MKKVVALLLASTLVFSMVACSNGKSDTKETPKETAGESQSVEDSSSADNSVSGGDPENAELSFAWWGNQVRTDNTTAACDYYITQHPGISIEYMPFQWSDYWTKLATDAAGNNLPDLIQQDYAYIAQFVESDDLLDLTPYIESGVLDVSNISDNILETGKSADGKIVALCAGVNAPSLIYNKTLTDSLGIEVPDNMTWAQFAEISAEIYEKSGVRTQYGYGNSENPLTYYIRSKGYSQFFDDDKLAYDDASVMVEYYQRLIDGVNEGWLMDAATLSGLDTSSIEQNPLVYYSDPQYGSWCSASFSNQLSAFQAAAPEGTELAITCWPSDDPAASNYLKPSQFFSVTTDTKNADAAVTYLYDVVEEHSSQIFPPLSNKTSEVINGPMQEIAEKVLFGEMTAEDAAEELFTRGNEIMGQ